MCLPTCATRNMSRLTAGILFAVFALSSCSGDDGEQNRTILPTIPVSSQVATVIVTPETSLLTVGDTLRLVASTRDAGGSPLLGRVVTWSADAPAIAIVSPAGVVIAVSAGLVRVTALSEGRTGTASITAVR